MAGALHSAASVDHFTPSYIVEAAREALGGHIFLDPCGNPCSNEVVKAHVVFETNGLSTRWYGPLFLNPPGVCDENPAGAGPWWRKLLEEWRRDGDWSAIYLGYSLEQLQTLQSWSEWSPLDFGLVCIPKKRIPFDVEAKALRAKLLIEQRHMHDRDKYARLEKKIAYVDARIKGGATRISGGSPTHGNFIVMLSHDVERERAMFRRAFEKIGWCS